MGPKALTGPMGLGPKGPGGPYLGPIKVKPSILATHFFQEEMPGQVIL